jgi:hypothetical protein
MPQFWSRGSAANTIGMLRGIQDCNQYILCAFRVQRNTPIQ